MLAISAITRAYVILSIGVQCCDAGIIGKRDSLHIRQSAPSIPLHSTLNSGLPTKGLTATINNDTVVGNPLQLQYGNHTMYIHAQSLPSMNKTHGLATVVQSRIAYNRLFAESGAMATAPFPEIFWKYISTFELEYRIDQAFIDKPFKWRAIDDSLHMITQFVQDYKFRGAPATSVPSLCWILYELELGGVIRQVGYGLFTASIDAGPACAAPSVNAIA